MNRRLVISTVCSLALVFFMVPEARTQSVSHSSWETVQPSVDVDYAYFLSDTTDRVHLEVYYTIFNFGLKFEAEGDQFVAEYELTVAVDDRDQNAVDVFRADKRVVAPSEQKTRSRYDFRTSQAEFDLEPGKYLVKFSVRDHKSGEVYNRDLEIKLDDLNREHPTLSTVEFVHHVEAASENDHVFNKGSLMVIPSVTRQYGGEEDSRLLYYHELYRGEQDSVRVTVETVVRSRGKGMVYRDTMVSVLVDPVERQLREISTAEFAPGKYEVEIFVRGRRNKKLDQVKGTFSVMWSQLALLKHDYKTALAQLEVIAEPGEVKELKKLDDLTDRIKAFNDFWLARDPSVGTVENEVKNEFYRRIEYSNQRFRHLRREGWRSDRGRVYIKHGEPDQIDDIPMSASYYPYQIWHYYTRGEYLKFLFVDEEQDGDYRIQFPYDGRGQSPDF